MHIDDLTDQRLINLLSDANSDIRAENLALRDEISRLYRDLSVAREARDIWKKRYQLEIASPGF